MHNQRMGTPASDIKGKQVMQEPPLQGSIYNTAAYGQSYQPQMLPMESMQHQQSQFQQAPQDLQISDTDFEAAFQDALQQAEELEQMQTDPQEVYNSNGIEVDSPSSKQLPIGSDAINYIEQADRTHDQDVKDADELARTAGQLLNMVQHDTSDKMKNSQFLDLMRRIRDREVEVQNNDLQSTATSNGKGAYVENETDFYHEIPQSATHAQSTRTQMADTSTESAMRTHDPNTFEFPDMNAVYDYTAQTESAQSPPEYQYSSHDDEYPNPQSQIQALHPGGKWYPEQKSPRTARAEFQGGAEMSGAVGANNNTSMSGLMNIGSGPSGVGLGMDSGESHTLGSGISAEDFEGRYDENAMSGMRFGTQYQRQA